MGVTLRVRGGLVGVRGGWGRRPSGGRSRLRELGRGDLAVEVGVEEGEGAREVLLAQLVRIRVRVGVRAGVRVRVRVRIRVRANLTLTLTLTFS